MFNPKSFRLFLVTSLTFIGLTIAPSSVVGLLINLSVAAVRYDFDGDGKTDPTVIRFLPDGPMYWYTAKSTGGTSVTQWGFDIFGDGVSDWAANADYDGDGKTDLAVWREPISQPQPAFGEQAFFYILYSATGTYAAIPWGRSRNSNYQDFPYRGDYDGDGKEDVAIARQTNGTVTKNYYYILQSRDGYRVKQFGNSGDYNVPGDYDGDGKTDFAVARVNSQNRYDYYIERSSDGSWQTATFGNRFSDFVIRNADFDGDGKTDITVWGGNNQGGGSGMWSWIRSSDGAAESIRWGYNQLVDTPALGDYDGDGKTDLAIYRVNTFGACDQPNYFWIRGSKMGVQTIQWGSCHGHPSYND